MCSSDLLEAGLKHYASPKRIEEFKTPPKPATVETEAVDEPAPNATSDFQLGVVLHRTKPAEAARILKLVINDDRFTAEPEEDNIVRVKYRSATKAEVEAMASVLEQMEKPETATQSTEPDQGTTPAAEPQNVPPRPVDEALLLAELTRFVGTWKLIDGEGQPMRYSRRGNKLEVE